MQIEESGKNRSAIRSIGEAAERLDRKSGDKIPKERFYDRLKKHMEPERPKVRRSPECSGIQTKRCEKIQEIKEVKVRRIPYSECDKTDINILEGYTLKAKLEPGQDGKTDSSCSVYVEMKDDGGNIRAYQFDAAGLKKDSSSAMERIAYEVIKQHFDQDLKGRDK